MIGFENFERLASADTFQKLDEAEQEQVRQMMQKKSLEPILEEFIDDDADLSNSAVTLPQVAVSESPLKKESSRRETRDTNA